MMGKLITGVSQVVARGGRGPRAAAGRPATVEDFERLYRRNADPWGYRTRWYERRKYAMTAACLPRERYGLAWEPACSIGVLTAWLAMRADLVVATDASPTAIDVASRTPLPDGAGRVEFSVGRLPGPPPVAPGTADLVVLSEVLYYLDDADRRQAIDVAADVLAPGGDLVAVHWRPQAEDTHTSGEPVHAWLRELPGWEPLVRLTDEEFLVDVLRRR